MATRLTIGIPTYQRRDAVSTTVSKLLEVILPPGVDVLVIDDASTDGTFEALQKMTSDPRLRLLQNEQNAGFVGNFSRLFEETNSEYLLVTSDEDEINVEHLPALIDLCVRSRPLLVSAQAMIDGSMFRGRAVERPMHAREWRSATNYISGITFAVEPSKPLLRPITALAADNGAAEVYPQVMLAAELLIRGEGIWFAAPLTTKREQLDSHIRDQRHGTYYFVPARWSQYLEFEAYLANLASESATEEQRARAQEMLDLHRSLLYGMLREGINQERPDLAKTFDAGARRALQPKAMQRAIAALQDPRRAWGAARDRLAAKRATSESL